MGKSTSNRKNRERKLEIRITESEHDRLQEESKRLLRTKASIVRQAIDTYFQQLV